MDELLLFKIHTSALSMKLLELRFVSQKERVMEGSGARDGGGETEKGGRNIHTYVRR